ncbi:MAG: dihydroneopterin aldolase, partial [Pseudomonadota bacterium]
MSETTDAARTLVEDGADTILIEDLLLPAEIGILDSEKGRRQSVRFSVEIETVPGYRDSVRKTGTFISYADTVF